MLFSFINAGKRLCFVAPNELSSSNLIRDVEFGVDMIEIDADVELDDDESVLCNNDSDCWFLSTVFKLLCSGAELIFIIIVITDVYLLIVCLILRITLI